MNRAKMNIEKLRSEMKPLDVSQPYIPSADEEAYLAFYGIDFQQSLAHVRQYFGHLPSIDLSAKPQRIACHYFENINAARTCFIVHGYMDHTGLYGKLINYLLHRGCSVVMMDMPGHGLSSGEPGETYATGLGDIYTFGPTFRAENSNTTRHLSEFWMIEPEMCFIEMKDLIDISEDYLKYCISYCLEKCGDEIDFFTSKYRESLKLDLEQILDKPFSRMTYTEVIDKLLQEISEGNVIVRDAVLEPKKFKKVAKGKHIFEEPIYWGCDLSSEHEKYMTDKVIKGPLVVTNYPKEIKSFYMKDDIDGKTVLAMDILVPNIGELIGGSMREDDYGILKSKMESRAVSIDWYLDIRKYGSVLHGGFGLGFEWLIMLITGIYNIKDVIPFPRYPKHCDC